MIIDVSRHQKEIDWDALEPHVKNEFVIIKATGDLHNGVDPYFNTNAQACIDRGIPFHVFHFTRAHSADEARKEARFFVETARQYNPLSYVLDLEDETLGDRNVIGIAQAFMSELRAQGVKEIGLYTGHFAYMGYGLDVIDRDYLWIARYGDKNNGKLPDEQHRPIPCDLWQYTSQARVPGITENTVDVSIIWGEKPLDYFTGRDKSMAVIIGSARGDENGNAHGGQPGDQTGGEVSTQNWYKHSKGWRVFRPKNPEVAERIAHDMQAACDNPHIGYDQYDRLTLYAVSEPLGFDCAAVTTDCETDCSALVRVCCAYAGVGLPNFNTETEPRALLDTGAVVELTGAQYTDGPNYLRRGDILVTRTKGHTAVVLTDGPRAYDTGDRTLRRGDRGEDVAEMQRLLLANGYSVGADGADGVFGAETERAVKSFQAHNGLKIDGICGQKTWKKLRESKKTYTVTIRGLSWQDAEDIRAQIPGAEVTEE